METTIGTRAVLWGSIGEELIGAVYDLRYMVICSIALILADLWWGYSESQKRWWYAKSIKNETLMEKFKWHKSRALRKTTNKVVDYLTYLAVGCLIGFAITEPMEICSHVWTAAIGMGIGCACEIASIVGHVIYVKMDLEVSIADAWRATVRFLGRLIKVRSEAIGDAVEGLGEEDYHHNHHHHKDYDGQMYDHEQNMEG